MKTKIKEYRARYNFTQEDLADKVGVRRETIVFLEKGKYNPSLKLAYDISKILHATIEEIFSF
jgi:putative transcriptional regulator